MEESVDVKALRAKFNSKPATFDPGNQSGGSPKSPRPAFGRAAVPLPEREPVHRLPPTGPPPSAGPNLQTLPPADPSKSAPNPRPPPTCGVRAAAPPGDTSRVRQTGELLQNMMLRQQRTPGAKPLPAPAAAAAVAAAISAPAAGSILPPLRQQPRQRSAGDVTPLVRPLPPEGPLPLKPKRPPIVNLQPFLRFRRGLAPAALRKGDAGSPGSADRRSSLPAVASPPQLPQRLDKPRGLQRQVASVDFEDDQDPYDDVGSVEKESCSDSSLRCLDRENNDDDDGDDIYEAIEEEQVPVNPVPTDKKNKKDAKKQQEQEKKERMLQQKKQNELKKNFQLQGEVEVLHTARARHDWYGGGKLDLSVRQGESVEILRLKNNPGGKWLARSLAGNYGYISNACVDIDYEAIKRKSLYHRRIETSPLPPPPPDPPQQSKSEAINRDSSLMEDDDYDDVQPIMEDFPPPPPEICDNPKVEKELKKKFKYEGPLRVLHTMMVDPNCVIKKPGGKDLSVSRGEVLDVIQLTNSKKALCRNGFGKYGYVFRSYLLPLEGDIYDDVDYALDVYDNDAPY